MAYCSNKAQEKARYLAVTEVRNDRSVAQVARRFGCFRSTVYRRIRKYEISLDSKEIIQVFDIFLLSALARIIHLEA